MDSFLAELQRTGTSDSSGRFHVDWRGASEALGRFLLPRPEDILHKLVQAAVGSRARALWVHEGGREIQVRWDGWEPSRQDLETLPGKLLDPTPSPGRDLALALNSAVRTHFPTVYVQTSHGTLKVSADAWEMKDRPRGPLVISLQGGTLKWGDLRLHGAPLQLHLPVKLKPLYQQPLAEIRHAGGRQHVWLPPSAELLCLDLEPEDDYPELSVGLHIDPSAQARIFLCVRGVWQAITRPMKVRGATAMISADGLNTDLSGLNVVEDDLLDDRLDDLRRETEQLLKELKKRFPGLQPHEQVAALQVKLK